MWSRIINNRKLSNINGRLQRIIYGCKFLIISKLFLHDKIKDWISREYKHKETSKHSNKAKRSVHEINN